jgi:hypothetical protein
MATLTITLEPTVLEAAKSVAERRKITLDQLVAESLTMVAPPPPTDADNEALIRLMNEGILGHIDRPLTRDEIYAERTWPRS